MSITILYEDNHLIAALKPAGVLSQPDKTGDTSLLDEVKTYLKEKYKKPGNVFVGLLHRLDRPASGIVLFAKTSKGASRLSEQFRNHAVEKSYHVLVSGKPKPDKSQRHFDGPVTISPKVNLVGQRGVLTNLLGKDEKLKKAAEYADGKEAKLFYEVVKSDDKHSLLKVKIDAGKFHQIRVQLSLAGFPIVGDVKYGGEKWSNDKAIALCATELSFMAATEEKKINLHIEIPKEWDSWLSTQ